MGKTDQDIVEIAQMLKKYAKQKKQQEVDDLWACVERYAIQESLKWNNLAEDFISLAAENMMKQIKKCRNKSEQKKYALNAIKYTHTKMAKLIKNCDKTQHIIDLELEMDDNTTDKLIEQETIKKINNAINELQSDTAKKIFKLRLAGHNNAEIARKLKISKQAVHEMYYRNIDDLKIKLGEEI